MTVPYFTILSDVMRALPLVEEVYEDVKIFESLKGVERQKAIVDDIEKLAGEVVNNFFANDPLAQEIVVGIQAALEGYKATLK